METMTLNSGSVIIQVAEHLEITQRHDRYTGLVQKTQLIPISEVGMTFMSRKYD